LQEQESNAADELSDCVTDAFGGGAAMQRFVLEFCDCVYIELRWTRA
jgi:hypothetical protein